MMVDKNEFRLELAQEAVRKAHKAQKRQYNKSASNSEFVVGDKSICLYACPEDRTQEEARVSI